MPITADLKGQFRNFVASRGGLYFKDHDLRNLEGAISLRMKSRGIHSLPGYYAYLTTSPQKENEFRELLNIITINHTYFFRNTPQFKAFREKVLPEVIARKLRGANTKEKPSLRIWSAGCATGEEAYSIAMVVSDLIGDVENWDINILATDASEDALRRAQKGLYGRNSAKHVDEEHIAKYFTKEEDRYAINDTIKNMVNFAYFNLMDEEYPAGFDVIFCRNVVIYFEFETTLKVMNKLFSALTDQGYMFIGYSETLQYMQERLRMVSWEDAIYYRKGLPRRAEAIAPVIPPKEEINIDKVLEEISRAEAEANIEAERKKAPLPEEIEDIIIRIIKKMHMKEYAAALALAEEAIIADGRALDPYFLAAEIFINQGKPDEAKSKLASVLKVDSLFAPAHYLYGCIYMEENDLDNAKKSLKKALFIDKRFLLAHFYLAQVFKNEGHARNAIREYRNTLKLLSKDDPSDIVAYSGGFNAATFMSVCRDNLERLKLEQE